ncbi:hypothetical protein BU17DRAFT_50505, partial [Hysterangium stoloniferum]
WIISNKYYTAPVHFSLEKTQDIMGTHATHVPACIFVFDPSESFKPEFTSLAKKLSDADFEVSLAVSLSLNSTTTELSTHDQDAFEAFFRDHGFEYVNGHQDTNTIQEDHDIDYMQGIPGLSRIIDALNTILWPSLVQHAPSRRTAKTRSIVHASIEDEGLHSLLKAEKDIQSREEREMAALEKWLEDGANDDVDPWDGIKVLASPSEPPAPPLSDNNVVSGFDDNFSDFVSAPPPDDLGIPSQEEVHAMSERILQMGREEDPVAAGGPEIAFDLSRVLAGLETMKTEIASIEDEDERRRAAAKVALSIVYAFEDKDE